ncbi:Dimer_Tnp_hAT domain-containing protein [Cephalotus follicularis]|uniref:Dimer_Tnp_hAT domain-containing protein n=1 Tax=Cephalotus follicularis TaxID=3775 RepID=A0A1Q3DGY7_CEPFO|nr:Dimer_Tnp_hAT domain-containing protein [Cephalotus follicularis]
MRRFNKAWFDKYSTSFEYSITDDAAYYLYYYLFNPSGKTFVNIGFKYWCLNAINHFLAFNTEDLVSFAKFYPNDFSTTDLMELKNQLETYIIDMHSYIEFTEVNDIGELAKRMKEKNKNKVYPLVYMLLKLVLILPVSTATMERAFFVMTIIKNRLRNRNGRSMDERHFG